MSNILKTLAAGSASSEPTDEYFNQTTLLLHGDGTNGAQNNTFLDSSTNTFTITRNGNTTQGTFSPFSADEGKWSNYFDGTDYLNWTSNTAFVFGTGNFTIEAFVYATGLAASNTTIMGTAAASEANCCVIGTNGSKFLRIQNNSAAFITDSVAFPEHQWVHICAVRSGTTLSLYKNGVRVGTATNSTSFTSGTGPFVGGDSTLADFPGYISNARFVKGAAVYDPTQTTITVPTEPLTAISGTSLLTCQSSRFKDNSTNNFAVANFVGTPSVQPFSPFLPSAAYSPSVNSGSAYFDGTGDYLTSPSVASLSGDFTMEFWIYPTVATNGGICGIGNYTTTTGFCLYQRVNRVSIFINNTESSIGATGLLLNNSWNHVALVRSSNVFKIYTNGVAGTTLSNSATFNDTLYVNAIFGGTASVRANSTYVSDFRVETSAVYTSDFTPPTAPADPTGSSVCLLMQNAGIFDNTGKNVLETVGNAQVDTATKVFGTGSMEFDGSGDYLTTPSNQSVSWGTGDFTIEGWFYWNSLASESAIMFGFGVGWLLYIFPANKLQWGRTSPQSPANLLTGSTTLATGQWYHIAVTRASGTVTLWVNGVSDGTVSDTANYSASGNLRVGISHSNLYFNGLIDDLRITRGVARYTTTFTPPDAPFPDQ